MEQKYYNSLEQIAMLEAELAARDDIQIELQRTKDELRDATEELAVANTKIRVLSANAGSNKENRIPELVRKPSRVSFQQGIPEGQAISGNVALTYSNVYAKQSMPRLSSSRSLRKIHGMLDQMKSLESRVANFKSSLPKPVTPIKPSLQSSPSHSSLRAMRSPTEPHTPVELPYSNQTITPSTSSSNIPVSRFRNSPSLGNTKASAQDAYLTLPPPRDETHSNGRPKSPYRVPDDIPRRSRSAAGYHTPHKKSHGHYGELTPIDGTPDGKHSKHELQESPSFQRRHESNRFGGSHQGPLERPSRTPSVNRSPTLRKTGETLPFSSLTLDEHPEIAKHRVEPINPGSYPPKNGAIPNGNGQMATKPPSRPGSAFGMLHSRQAVGHGRM